MKAGDVLIHKPSGFTGVLLERSSGGLVWFWDTEGRGNINVVALMSEDGEIRFFDAEVLILG